MNPPSVWHFSIFVLGKVLFLIFRFVLPVVWLQLIWWKVLLIAMVVDIVTSYYLALVFQVSHMVPEAGMPTSKKEDSKSIVEMDWAISQVRTTIDYGHGSWLTTFLTGGLNYQVTHHLFPGISQAHYPEIAPIVQKTCEEFGIDYVVKSNFKEAFMQHIKFLRIMGSIEI